MKRILMLFTLLIMTGTLVMAQTVVITGTVTSQEDGAALPGVNVTVKGTTIGAITGADGRYQLTAPANATTLFSPLSGCPRRKRSLAEETTSTSQWYQTLSLLKKL